MLRSAPVAALAVLVASLPVRARAAAPLPPEPGTWWEITTEMSITGASVPPELRGKPQTRTERECLPKKIPDRPPPADGDCAFSDYRRSGSRMTFKLTCSEGVTGEAELVWTADTYAGTTVMRGPGLENRMKMRGKRIGGDCDASEEERREQAGRGEGDGDLEAQRARMCADAAESGDPGPFLAAEPGEAPECPDAARFCAVLETRRGLVQLRQSGIDDAAQRAGKLCKKDVAAVEKRLCAAVAKEPERMIAADLVSSEFLFGSCPDVARSMAKRACAGREYSSMPDAQREFCTRWAQETLQGR